MAENEAYVRCWNNSDGTAPTHFITITDNCPCVQYSETTGNQVSHREPAGDMCSQSAGLFHMLWVHEPGHCGCMLKHEVLAAWFSGCWVSGESGLCAWAQLGLLRIEARLAPSELQSGAELAKQCC